MDLEQGRNFLSGLFDNYDIDINTWNGMPPDEQRDLATRWKKERETKGLSNNLEEELVLSQRASEMPNPVISDNATASNPSSLKGLLKKARLHDPQGAAELLNKENTPYKPGIQLGGDDEEAVEEENVGSAPRGGFSTTSALQNRLADYIKNKSGSAILEKKAEEEEFNLMSDRQRAETFDAKKEKDHLAEQFDSSVTSRPKWLQDIIDDPKKATGGQLPKWWSEEWMKKADDAGGIRPEPGESLLEFNDRLQGKDFTDKDLEGKISDEDIADQLVLDKQRESLKKPTAENLDIGPESGLDQGRVPEIKKLFNEKDPEAELIASEYEAKSGLMNIKKAENVKKADNKVKEKIKKDINKNLKKKVEEKPTNYFSRHRTEAAKVVEEAIPEITIKRFRDAYKPEEKEKIIKEEENKVVAIEDKKQIRASIKEQGPDKYYVDPLTGYALNLTKLSKRANAMQVANMLPAADRAVYLFSQEVIDKEDFDTMMGPGSRASLDLKLKRMQIERANYEIIAAKKKAEKDPKRAEYLSMFTNAMSNKNFGLVSYLGEKLGLEKDIMDRAEKSFKEYELDKLRSKSTGGGLEKGFKSDFAVPYSNVVNNKVKWVNYATSLIQTSGQFAEIMDTNGNIKTVDRSAKFRSYGLYEKYKMKNKTHAEQIKIFNRSPYRKALMTNENYHNKKGEFDPSILVNDKDAYEQYLLNDLVWMGLDDVYNEQYGEMVKWITKNSYNHEKEMARINKLLTAGATVNDKGEVKQNRIISN